MLCSAIPMTARSELGADRERKLGWKGLVKGASETASGASVNGAWAAPTSYNPTLLITPFPNAQHLIHAGEVPAGQIPSNGEGLLGGGGGQVRGVGMVVVVVPGVGRPQVQKSPLQPILVVWGAGNPWLRPVSSMSPLLQLNGVPVRLPCIPQGRPCLHRHLVVL